MSGARAEIVPEPDSFAPTAVQLSTERHETPSNSPWREKAVAEADPEALRRTNTGTKVPSRRRETRGEAIPPGPYCTPTATHELFEGQATALKVPPSEARGRRLGRVTHFPPTRSSARGRS